MPISWFMDEKPSRDIVDTVRKHLILKGHKVLNRLPLTTQMLLTPSFLPMTSAALTTQTTRPYNNWTGTCRGLRDKKPCANVVAGPFWANCLSKGRNYHWIFQKLPIENTTPTWRVLNKQFTTTAQQNRTFQIFCGRSPVNILWTSTSNLSTKEESKLPARIRAPPLPRGQSG